MKHIKDKCISILNKFKGNPNVNFNPLDFTPNPIIDIDLKGNIIYLNPNIQELFPSLSQESLSHPYLEDIVKWLRMVQNDMYAKPHTKSWFREVKVDSQYYEQVFQKTQKSGITRIYGTNISKKVNKLNKLTEERNQANELTKLKSEFIANMSHEIRTPMSGIIGIADILLETDLTKSQNSYLAMLKDSSKHLLFILNDLLDLSKAETGKLEVLKEKFNFNKSIGHLVAQFKVTAEEKNLQFETTIDSNIPKELVGDSVRLTQILINLLGNAFKFTPESGSVLLEVLIEKELKDSIILQFKVQDSGIGIPLNKQKDILKAFIQADSSVTKKYGGTGLGLAITSSLLELMDSSLKLVSTEGNGSTFSFSLKVLKPEKKDKEVPVNNEDLKKILNKAKTVKNTYDILIVEDDEVNKKIANYVLAEAGHTVKTASNGLECMELVKKHVFDLILMDCQMPEMDGFEAVTAIRQRERILGVRVPIIALTALAMKDDKDKCLEVGMDVYIRKPFEKVKLLKMIEKLIEKSRKIDK